LHARQVIGGNQRTYVGPPALEHVREGEQCRLMRGAISMQADATSVHSGRQSGRQSRVGNRR
jgi:hypothetical protein